MKCKNKSYNHRTKIEQKRNNNINQQPTTTTTTEAAEAAAASESWASHLKVLTLCIAPQYLDGRLVVTIVKTLKHTFKRRRR